MYDGRTFPDPDPSLSVDDVRRQLADYFPELANADTREVRQGDDTLYTFSRRIGTKGSGRRRRRPPRLASILQQVPERRLHIFELVAELVGSDGTLDVDEAARRQPELALAEAEAQSYAQATQRLLARLRSVAPR